MDLIILIGLAVSILAILIATWFFTRKSGNQNQKQNGMFYLVVLIKTLSHH